MSNSLKYNKILISISLTLLGMFSLQAQNGGGYFNQAQNLFKAKNYYEASVVYEKYLATEAQYNALPVCCHYRKQS